MLSITEAEAIEKQQEALKAIRKPKPERPAPKERVKRILPPARLERLEAKLANLPEDEQAAVTAILARYKIHSRTQREAYLREALNLVERSLICTCNSCAGLSRKERLERCVE